MAYNGEDILNIDIDPDLLIGLVGKLSLNNIPDFSETLQCLENNATIAPLENNASPSYVPLHCDIPSSNHPVERTYSGSLSLNNNSSSNRLQWDLPSLGHPVKSSCSNSSLSLDNNSSSVPLQWDIPSLGHPVESSCPCSSLSLNNSSSSVPLQWDMPSLDHPVESSSSGSLSLNNNSSSAPLQWDTLSLGHPLESSCSTSLSLNNNQSKEGFLSAIGLLSSPRTIKARNSSSSLYDSLDDSSNSCDSFAFGITRFKESCRAKDKQAKSKKGSSKKKTNIKVDVLENDTRDNAESHWHNLPFFSGASFPHKSVNNLHDVFAAGEMVYDIQLSDIDGSSKLPFNSYESCSGSPNHDSCSGSPNHDSCSGSPNHDSCDAIDKTDDLVEKSVCSPDSGISTSPYPGAVSPFSPQTDDSEEYDDRHYEDDLELLLAELIEIENSLKCAEIPQSNVKVPVLSDSKSVEDHKERIMNFLKEPIFNDLKSQLSLLKGGNDKLSFPELLLENAARSDFTLSSKTTKKPSPRSKKHKLGMEFKSAVKNELCRHSSIFSKGKHFSSRNKILKQIQDDERIQKQVKLIQKLIVSKKLKRMDIDDRENKKRRIHLNDPCCKPQEELGYE